MYHYNWGGEELWLLAERAVYMPLHKTLVVSDLHFTKTGHFRKSGVPVPQQVFVEDMQRLFALVQKNKIEHTVVVGDFFHSDANKELNLFSRWRNDFSQLTISLIRGNHDILEDEWYNENAIDVYDENVFSINNISFIHDYSLLEKEALHDATYYISGHIHPSVFIGGKNRQGMRLPCFYFSENMAVLPAFSKFSGYATIKPGKQDAVFAIMNDKVMKV